MEKKREPTTLLLDKDLKLKAQEQARQNGMTFSDYVNYLLREELGD